ncbi:oligosaccharide flippase family protein [Aneurinibacillus migulanus]|uniref:oligosaccharide flippase family protein n=1 Tax=Aneurinibacillus migulanus TaxID=47500 RepID=UPI000697DBDE|nr:oligosaccharide flippase family protein [Aneurinibacillus migulanus]CEH32066.1 Copper amine oxidase domain protein [Aneurinibacillus migulanus]
MSKNSFLKGTLILTLAAVISRVLGVGQRVPLQHIMGNDGMTLYTISYNIYSMLLIIATLGVPSALSKQISEYTAIGKYHEAYQTYKAARNFALVTGFVMFVFMMVIAPYYAEYALAPQADLAIRAIAPAMLLFPLIAIMRGYFQGLQFMQPTGLSQIMEQILRVATAVALPLLLLYMGYNKDVAVAGASFGAVTGSIAACGVMIYFYKKRRTEQKQQIAAQASHTKLTYRQIYSKMIRLSLPITLSALAVPLIYFIDTSTSLRLLTPQEERISVAVNHKEAMVGDKEIILPVAPYLHNNNTTMVPLEPVSKAMGAKLTWDADKKRAFYERGPVKMTLTLGQDVKLSKKPLGPLQYAPGTNVPSVPLRFFTEQLHTYQEAVETLGILGGSAQSLAGLPIILAIALSSSIIPVVSSAHSRRDSREVQRMSSMALRVALITGVPAALYLTVAAYPVNGFLFSNTEATYTKAAWIIAFLCFGTIFQILMMTSSGILQGLGRTNLPMRHVAIGILTKLAGNYALAPLFGIYGIIMATSLCFIVVMGLNLRAINRYTRLTILGEKWRGFLLSSLLLCAIGLSIVWIGFKVQPFVSMPAFLFFGIEAAVIAGCSMGGYGIALFWLKGIDVQEIRYFPRIAQKVYHLLARYRIVPAYVESANQQQKSGLP